ncbi:MAG: HAMP domain-containing sensor histidine kinase [Desulfobacteraceae bacterium]
MYGDKNGLQQVFLNLINNAVDALEEKQKDERKIRIHATSNGDSVHIEIADNGCGIPEEVKQSIFDPFFTTKGEDKGTGLGLSIIGTILQKHNASIQLTSDVNQGTCFSISIPAI